MLDFGYFASLIRQSKFAALTLTTNVFLRHLFIKGDLVIEMFPFWQEEFATGRVYRNLSNLHR